MGRDKKTILLTKVSKQIKELFIRFMYVKVLVGLQTYSFNTKHTKF